MRSRGCWRATLLLVFAGLFGMLPAQEGGPAPASEKTAREKTSSEKAAGEKPNGDRAPQKSAPPGERKSRGVRSAREQFTRASGELLDLQARIRAAEARLLDRRRTSEERLRDLAAEKLAAERSLESLKGAGEAREKVLASLKASLAAREKEAARLQHELSAALEPLKQHFDRVEKLIDGGIAWKVNERKAAVRKARESFGGRDAQPAPGLQRAGLLQEEEEALGKLVEAGAVEVELHGESAAVPAFHLGLLGVVLVSPEGKIAGFAGPGQSLKEGLDASKGHTDASKGYLQAIEILRRRRAPGLVDLHVPSLPTQVEEAK